MRSIGYVMGGGLANFDDCVDRAHSETPTRVVVSLCCAEAPTEFYLIRYLLGKYRWEFGSEVVEFEETYGGCFSHESEKRQRRSVDNANHRLAQHLGCLEEMGIPREMHQHQFEYSVIFAQRQV
jgi:hypothetical protein